jgi:hypothetical protein
MGYAEVINIDNQFNNGGDNNDERIIAEPTFASNQAAIVHGSVV